MYNIDKLAANFKNSMEWMLESKCGSEIRDDLLMLIKSRDEFLSNPDSPRALKALIAQIIRRSEFYAKTKEFDREIGAFMEKFGKNFRTSRSRIELINLTNKLAPSHYRSEAEKKIREFLMYPNIKQFAEELHELALRGKTSVLGKKGRDNFLRDFGYWDRAPIDRHEKRFLIRTGIFHSCSINSKKDPLKEASLLKTLARFCQNYLKGFLVFNVDLGKAPGIVDVFIWSFCCNKRLNICGSTPNCGDCTLNEACLYYTVNCKS